MRTIPLKRVAHVTYGLGQPPPPAIDGIPILRATNIYRGKILREGLIFAELEDLPLERAPLLKAGEILVVRSGAYTADSALVTEEWEGAAPGYDLRVTPFPGIEPRYIAYSLLGSRGMDEMRLASSRAAQPHLNAEELGEVGIDLVPFEEQRAIADFLDRETAYISTLIEKKKRLVAALHSRFWAAYSSRIDASGRPLVPLRRFLTSITDGPFGSNLKSDHYQIGEDGVRVIRLGNIGFAEFRDDDRAFIPQSHFELLCRYEVKEGDLVIAGLGDKNQQLGRACVVPAIGKAIVKADCYRARANHRAIAEYLAYYLSSPSGKSRVELASRGTTRSRINVEIARDILVPHLPLQEQADLVEWADRHRAVTRRCASSLKVQLERLAERRQALVTAAVSGRMEVARSA